MRMRIAAARRLLHVAAALAPVVTAVALGLLAPAPAVALITHNFESSFNGSGAPGGPFVLSGPDAFDQASGDVYVLDSGAQVVDEFAPSGNYAGVQITGASTPAGSFSFFSFSGVAVDNSGGANSGDVYVADSSDHVVDRFSSSGAYQCQITGATSPSASECNGPSGSATPAGSMTPTGLAVDGSGDLYVADFSHNVVDVFGPSGAYVRQIADSHITDPETIALDSAGDLYVASFSPSDVVKFDAAGAFVATVDGNTSFGVGVDPATGHVYVGESGDVAEYDTSGNLVDTFGSGTVGSELFGIAVRPSTGEVYVGDFVNNVVEVFTAPFVLPDVATAAVTNPQATSVTFNGTVNPDGVQVTGCRFDYGTTTAYGQSAPCVETVGSGSSPVSVHADVTGLQAGASYHFRLEASNANGTNYSSDATWGPLVDGESATGATGSSVTLQAQVNPDGFDTTYHFEYGTTTSYGTSVPVPDADIGSGQTDQTASQSIAGLVPNTIYHFRVVATNSQRMVDGPDQTFTTNPAVAPVAANSASCPNAQFRTGPSASLPDCRGYEQVTPVNKGGTADMFLPTVTAPLALASDSGDKVLLATAASFGPTPAGGFSSGYVFSRAPAGWQLQPVQPPNSGDVSYDVGGHEALVSPDLSQVAADVHPASNADLSFSTPVTMAFGPVGGPYTPAASVQLGSIFDGGFEGAAGDFSHILLQSTDHTLAPGAGGQVAGSNALYEWTDGQLVLVNVNSGGSLTSACGAILGAWTAIGLTHNAVSSDGSKVFFESPDPLMTAPTGSTPTPGCPGGLSNPQLDPPHLYARVNGSRTVDVSAPNPGVVDPSGFQPVEYIGAAADGSKVFFATRTELTADDTTHDMELYEYDTTSGTLTRVSRGASGHADGNVQWALVSDDGSTVYFAATGQLTPDAPAPAAGDADLYYYDTATGTTHYIATLNVSADSPMGASLTANGVLADSNGDAVVSGSQSDWYTTPDGRFLLFSSASDITGYNPGNGCGGNPCHELYRYDVGDASVTCVSCDPSGAPAVGDAEFTFAGLLYADARPPRPISDDGSYVFFDSPDQLVPRATNHVRDVYEWHNGQLSLVSSGTDPLDSFFVDSSADGRDVFFGTHAQLAATDTDFEGDLYDARIGGGFPPPPAGPSCSGEGCQGSPGSPSTLLGGAPSSMTFSGAGNPVTHGATPKKKAGKKHKVKKRGRHHKNRRRHARRRK